MINLRTSGILAGCIALLTTASANAQHRHGSGHTDFVQHGGHVDAVHHHGRHFGHNNWNYVVPHHDAHHHNGSYYVQDNSYYYTPTPVVRVAPTTIQTAELYPVQVVQKPVQLQFGGYARFEDLSGRLEVEINRLCLDMHYNYQHNPGFAEAYRDAYALLESAKFVHAKEHQGDRDAIRHHVTQMDQLMHHVLEGIRPWSRHHSRQVASGGVIEKSSAVEAILHHLCYDVGVEPHGDDEPAPAPNAVEEQAPAPGAVINSPPPGF
jgi:hypothetical protein